MTCSPPGMRPPSTVSPGTLAVEEGTGERDLPAVALADRVARVLRGALEELPAAEDLAVDRFAEDRGDVRGQRLVGHAVPVARHSRVRGPPRRGRGPGAPPG